LLLVPSTVAAWCFAFFMSVVLHEVVVGRCLDSDAPAPEYCRASWFPLEFLRDALVFFGVGLSAVAVVMVAAVVAPSHKRHVAWIALTAGAALAAAMGYSTGARSGYARAQAADQRAAIAR
jgi:membrane protein DedA with SNARE-associated domain